MHTPAPTTAAATDTPPWQPNLADRWLIIGSGADLNGRNLGQAIDSGRLGKICRVNKPYGTPSDVGTRCDLLVTRWTPWVQKHFPHLPAGTPTIILNEHTGAGFTAQEHAAACAELGHPQASAGMLAAFILLNRGVRHISAIGFGYHPATGWPAEKRYPEGTVDKNPHYNWPREQNWLARNITLI